eukprot:scaffold3540_cov147-Isochrysis_galbana.AAC.9
MHVTPAETCRLQCTYTHITLQLVPTHHYAAGRLYIDQSTHPRTPSPFQTGAPTPNKRLTPTLDLVGTSICCHSNLHAPPRGQPFPTPPNRAPPPAAAPPRPATRDISRTYAAHPLLPAPQPPPWGWWHGCHLYPLAAVPPASQARESDAPTSSGSAAASNANNQPQTRV